MSKFASVASHDLKNVVGGLSNVSYYLSRALKVENETQKKMLSMLSTEVVELNKRITEILDNFIQKIIRDLTKKQLSQNS